VTRIKLNQHYNTLTKADFSEFMAMQSENPMEGFDPAITLLSLLLLLLLQAEKPMEGFDPANVERVVRNVDNFSIWQVLLP